MVKKNLERETRIKKEKIRLEKELAKKAKEEALAAKKAIKEARLAAKKEARIQQLKSQKKKKDPNSVDEEQNENEEGDKIDEEEGAEDQEDEDNEVIDDAEEEEEPEEPEEEPDQDAQAGDQEDEEDGGQEGQEDPDNPEGIVLSKGEFNLLDPNLFTEPIENIDDISFNYKEELFYFEYSIKGHCRLEEYFNALKKGLRSTVIFGKLAYQSLLTPYSVTLVDSVKKLCTLLPIFAKIMESPSLSIEKCSESLIRSKLKDLSVIGANLADLATSIAMGLTIVRRDYLVSTESLNTEEINKMGPLVYAGLKEQKLTDHQILAVIDCKFVEASCLRNLADKNWSVKQIPHVSIKSGSDHLGRKNCWRDCW